MPTTDFDCCVKGHAPVAHAIPIGTPVAVTRGGVAQGWDVVVHRHDRNGTYRLRFPANDTFVTVHADEVESLAEVTR